MRYNSSDFKSDDKEDEETNRSRLSSDDEKDEETQERILHTISNFLDTVGKLINPNFSSKVLFNLLIVNFLLIYLFV